MSRTGLTNFQVMLIEIEVGIGTIYGYYSCRYCQNITADVNMKNHLNQLWKQFQHTSCRNNYFSFLGYMIEKIGKKIAVKSIVEDLLRLKSQFCLNSCRNSQLLSPIISFSICSENIFNKLDPGTQINLLGTQVKITSCKNTFLLVLSGTLGKFCDHLMVVFNQEAHLNHFRNLFHPSCGNNLFFVFINDLGKRR